MFQALGAFLVAMCTPMVARVLFALGMGSISYSGLSILVNQLINNVINNFAGIGGSSLQILNLCGFGAAISIIASGLITKASLMAISKIGSLMTSS